MKFIGKFYIAFVRWYFMRWFRANPWWPLSYFDRRFANFIPHKWYDSQIYTREQCKRCSMNSLYVLLSNFVWAIWQENVINNGDVNVVHSICINAIIAVVFVVVSSVISEIVTVFGGKDRVDSLNMYRTVHIVYNVSVHFFSIFCSIS